MGGRLCKALKKKDSTSYIVTTPVEGKTWEKASSDLPVVADEPVYRDVGRRKSVFAEAYNPEEDSGNDTRVFISFL